MVKGHSAKRLIAALLIASTAVLAGCGGSDSKDSAASCTADNARAVTQDFITNSKFDVDCAKVATGVAFYFVNNDDADHTVTTAEGAPEAFDADIPKKNSTYSHTFTKTGTYDITCKRHNEKMTLIVTAA